MKLSKAQAEIIKRLRKKDVLHFISGVNACCFWTISHKNVSWATIAKLEYLNLIKRPADGGHGYMELTEAGKAIEL